MLPPARIYETVLYAADLEEAAEFYRRVLKLELLSATELMLVFSVGENYLLIFDPRKSSVAGRQVPSHGPAGAGHIAFPVPKADLPSWRMHLREQQIPIEREVSWSEGRRGTSVYFRDPAGNSVELAPPILWDHLRSS